MAEFSRKSRSKRILENINTAQATKKQVYDFYQRWRKQYGVKGKGLDFAKSKKADIVRELHELEARQSAVIKQAPVQRFERKYEQIKEQMKSPSQEVIESLKKLQRQAEQLEKAGKISKQKADLLRVETQQPKPRYKGGSQTHSKQRKNVYYKGRYAHDYIKKMCDDALLDTEDFEDSKEIWYTIDLINNNQDDFDFFESHYQGNYKKGTRDYYLGEGGFEDFLSACRNFERDLQAKGEKIPEKYTDEYWNALREWLAGNGGVTQL